MAIDLAIRKSHPAYLLQVPLSQQIEYTASVVVCALTGMVLFRTHAAEARRLVDTGAAEPAQKGRKCRQLILTQAHYSERGNTNTGRKYTRDEPVGPDDALIGYVCQHKRIDKLERPLFQLSVLENLAPFRVGA